MHYHVIENTPGYLPDSDPATFRNEADAQAYADELGHELEEMGYNVDGFGTWRLDAELDEHDLGRVITVDPCNEADCEATLDADDA